MAVILSNFRIFPMNIVLKSAATALLISAFSAFAAPVLKFDQYFTDCAVLQQGVGIPVSGKATPGASVKVDLAGKSASSTADANGRWVVNLPAPKTGGPYDLVATSGEERCTATNILVGEVWLVSGQSNAYFPLNRFEQKEDWLKDADYPEIRFMEITWQPPHMRKPDRWNVVTPQTAGNCSATGFFFAKALQKKLKAPVGIVTAASDGSIIQKWLSEEALRNVPGMPEQMAKQEAAEKLWSEFCKERDRRKKLPPDEVKALGELKSPPYPAKSYAGLFETYIEPMIPFPFKGVIWYQGESNGMFAQGYCYRFYLHEMIRDWRKRWNAPEMPFLVVQLPHYDHSQIWGDVRDSQTWVSHREKAVYIVPTFDIGDMKNIHPPRKPELGARLVDFARKYVYGEKGLAPEGPVFLEVEPKDGELLARFDTASPIASRDGQPLRGFQVAGADGKFRSGTARIVDARTIAVSCKTIAEPVALRYGWEAPDEVNFFDAAGNPAGAFRSDSFNLPTQ